MKILTVLFYRSLNDNKLSGELPDVFQNLVGLINLYACLLFLFFYKLVWVVLVICYLCAETYLLTI